MVKWSVQHNVSYGVIVSNQSLAVQRFSQAEDQTRVYGAAREETITVSCRLDASPPVVAFSWRFNSSGDVVDLKDEYVASDGLSSLLQYTVSRFVVRIYAKNSKCRRSAKKIMRGYTDRDSTERHIAPVMGQPSANNFSDVPIAQILGCVVGILGSLVLIALVTVLVVRLKKDKKRPSKSKVVAAGTKDEELNGTCYYKMALGQVLYPELVYQIQAHQYSPEPHQALIVSADGYSDTEMSDSSSLRSRIRHSSMPSGASAASCLLTVSPVNPVCVTNATPISRGVGSNGNKRTVFHRACF
ncbi:hypothetical protein HAZT_HAZT004963 [Hyalella azteca]|uniref:Ig-like domain-containing protein n=1 Tax=Hyalella azteca TaxID=294128 RepID=A0A6A0H1E9_HYAAZ|nr:hypothetical protein HAZT_HAZT004963 [Hyalella azteca]